MVVGSSPVAVTNTAQNFSFGRSFSNSNTSKCFSFVAFMLFCNVAYVFVAGETHITRLKSFYRLHALFICLFIVSNDCKGMLYIVFLYDNTTNMFIYVH